MKAVNEVFDSPGRDRARSRPAASHLPRHQFLRPLRASRLQLGGHRPRRGPAPGRLSPRTRGGRLPRGRQPATTTLLPPVSRMAPHVATVSAGRVSCWSCQSPVSAQDGAGVRDPVARVLLDSPVPHPSTAPSTTWFLQR